MSELPSLPFIDRYPSIDGESLSPIERIVLTHDGTVMRLLEALIGRCVEVDIVDRWIRDETLYRNVQLKPCDDDRPLAWAEAEVDLGSLDGRHTHVLREQDVGIGRLFREERFETFRELVNFDRVTFDERLPAFVDADGEVLFVRTYDVYHSEADIMEITEYFPKDGFEEFLVGPDREPPQH